MAARFELYKDSFGDYRFQLLDRDGQLILRSERFASKLRARSEIASVQTSATNDDCYARLVDADGQHYFELKGSDGEVLGTSEAFQTTAARESSIRSVKASAPAATWQDASY